MVVGKVGRGRTGDCNCGSAIEKSHIHECLCLVSLVLKCSMCGDSDCGGDSGGGKKCKV